MFAPGMLLELAACAIGVCILFAVAFVLVVQGEQEEDPAQGLPARPPQLFTDTQRGTEWGRILQQNVDGVFYAQSTCRDVLWVQRVAMMDILQALKRDVDELVRAKKSADVRKDLERISSTYEQQAKDRMQQALARCPNEATAQWSARLQGMVRTHALAYAGILQGNADRYTAEQ